MLRIITPWLLESRWNISNALKTPAGSTPCRVGGIHPMHQQNEEKRLLKVKEVATIFRLSKSAVYNLISRGVLPCVNLASGSRMVPRVRLADVEQFIQGRLIPARTGQ